VRPAQKRRIQLLPANAAICRSHLVALQNKTGRRMAPRLSQIVQILFASFETRLSGAPQDED
jgi:hypothetical protein